MRIKIRLVTAVATLVIALLAILGALAASVITYQNSLDTLAADRVAPLRQMFQISSALTRIEITGSDLLQSDKSLAVAPERMTRALGEIDAQWRQYETTYLTPEEVVLARRAHQALADMRVSLYRFMHLIKPTPGAPAALEFAASLRPLIEEARRQLDALVDLQQRVSNEVLAAAKRQKTLSLLVAIGAGLLGILAVIYTLYIVRRFILSPLNDARRALSDLATGQVDQTVPTAEAIEMDELLGDIRQTRNKLADIVREQSSVMRRADEFGAQLEAMFKYSPFGIFIKDREGRFVTLNDAEARVWGRPKETFIGKTADMFLSPEHAEKARASDRHVFETGEPIAVEYRGGPNSTYEWLQTIKFPIRNRDGEIFALAAIDIDLSEMRRKTRDMEAASFQLRRSSEMTGMHYWFWHRNRTKGIERIIYDGDEWALPAEGYDIVKDYDQFLKTRVHPDDRARMKPIYDDFITQRINAYEVEYRFLRDNGDWMNAKVWAQRVFEEGTGDEEIHVISQDISAIKQREEELLTAKMRAEVADRAKTDFLANMSHELRTPLNPILGFAEVLQHKFARLGDSETVSYLSLIHEGGENMLRTINIILEFAQLDVIDTPLEQFEVGLRELFDASIGAVQARGMAGEVTFATHLEDERHCVMAEERALRRALTNVLTNAAQHAPLGSVVTVRAERLGNDECAISVMDEGGGFPADLLPDIGKAFVRGGDALHHHHGGIGLGLTIAGKLMALQGGRIDVENRPAGGAKVSLVFPAGRLIEGHPVLAAMLARPAK